MKKTYFTLFVAFICLLSFMTHAQERHSVSLSYSPISLRGLEYSWKENTGGRRVTIIPGEYGYKAVGYDQSYPGALMLSYTFTLAERLRIGVDVGYEGVKKKWDLYEDPQGPQTVNQQIHYLYFLPGGGYAYVSHPSFSLSSSIYVGMAYRWSDFRYSLPKDKQSYAFAAQIWLVAMQLKWGAFALTGDVGYGSLGFCRVGIGCNF